MSATVAPSTVVAEPNIRADTQEQIDKRMDLHKRFLRAGIADPAILAEIPRDVLLMLLPDDDPAFVERELVVGAAAVRRGQDVYFRHVRVADLPELPPRRERRTSGLRRTFFNWDGSIRAQEVVGADGEWHSVTVTGDAPDQE